jgi:4-hydroxybenzoate polyprenyltransferase
VPEVTGQLASTAAVPRGYASGMPSGFPTTRAAWRERLPLYWRLVRGDRPVGALLLLWPTLWALWLAAGAHPPPWPTALKLGVVFVGGVWLTRSAGCVVNDYADRWLDPHVERTRDRPLATGAVAPREAIGLFVVLMLLALLLVSFTNRLTIWLSVAAVALAATYPFLKRHTYLPQVWLGLAFGWGIPMAFAAVTGTIPPQAWLLFLANLLWTTGYDTWYAMVDRDDDLRMGAKSTAILFGDADLVALGVLYAGFGVAMVLLGRQLGLGVNYYAGLAVAAGFVAWQFVLGRRRTRGAYFAAFLANQWVGLAIFLGLVLEFAMRPVAAAA